MQSKAIVDSETMGKGSLEKVYTVSFGWQGLIFCNRKRLLLECIVPTVHLEVKGYAARVFLVISLGILGRIPGRLNVESYSTILDNFMLPTLWQFYGDFRMKISPGMLRGPQCLGMMTMVSSDWTYLRRTQTITLSSILECRLNGCPTVRYW